MCVYVYMKMLLLYDRFYTSNTSIREITEHQYVGKNILIL